MFLLNVLLFFVAYRILEFMLLLCVKHFSSQKSVI